MPIFASLLTDTKDKKTSQKILAGTRHGNKYFRIQNYHPNYYVGNTDLGPASTSRMDTRLNMPRN